MLLALLAVPWTVIVAAATPAPAAATASTLIDVDSVIRSVTASQSATIVSRWIIPAMAAATAIVARFRMCPVSARK